MGKVLGFLLAYGAVPLLIYLYAQTGSDAYKYILGFLVWGYFILMAGSSLLLAKVAWVAGHREQLRQKLRARAAASMAHLALGIVLGTAIFVYVNNILGIVYVASLLVVQVFRWRIMHGGA